MIRGNDRPLTKNPTDINVQLDMSIHNRFDVEVIRDKKVIQKAYAENIILNSLWTRLFIPQTYNNYIRIGKGNGTLSPTRTALFDDLGYNKSAIAQTEEQNWSQGWVSVRKQFQLAENEFVGQTLTEVGIAYDRSVNALVTHAMFKDMNGQQISINKTNTDIINIYATVFVRWPTTGWDNGTIKIVPNAGNITLLQYLTGRSYTYQANRLYYASGGEYSLYPRYGFPTNENYALTPIYNVTNRTISYTAARLPAAMANVSGFQRLIMGYRNTDSYPNYSFIELKTGGTWYPSSQIVAESLGIGDGITTSFSCDFGFVTSATVYVNGVAYPNVTINTTAPPRAQANRNMGLYFELIPELSTAGALSAPLNGAYFYGTGGFSGPINTITYYNPFYELGIKTTKGFYASIFVSNDLITWVQIHNGTNGGSEDRTVPETYRNYKYWQVRDAQPYYGGASYVTFLTVNTQPSSFIFDVAPPVGSIITADYTTRAIAKDINHVFDFNCTIQLGEYTE